MQQAKAAREAAATSSRKASQPADVSPELPFSAEDSIAELQELATSAGAEVVGQFLQRKEKPDPATLIGSGKLEEIAGAAASSQADLILFDHDLTPSQQRNIEKIVEARVIDLAYGSGALPPNSFYERLTVQISAWPKKAPEGGTPGPASGVFGDTAAVR